MVSITRTQLRHCFVHVIITAAHATWTPARTRDCMDTSQVSWESDRSCGNGLQGKSPINCSGAGSGLKHQCVVRLVTIFTHPAARTHF